jgi:hypothetical protein
LFLPPPFPSTTPKGIVILSEVEGPAAGLAVAFPYLFVVIPQCQRRKPHFPPQRGTRANYGNRSHFGSSPYCIHGKHLNRLRLTYPIFLFRVFRPEIACQALKPPKSNKPDKIELAF